MFIRIMLLPFPMLPTKNKIGKRKVSSGSDLAFELAIYSGFDLQ